MEALKDFFSDKEVRHVLDVGTGKGQFLELLTTLFPDADFFGVDPDPVSIGEAASHYPGIIFRVMAAEKLDFRDESFDLVSLSMALHHLSKIQKSLKEMKRVLTREGWIIISELFNDNLTPAQEAQQLYHHFRSRIDRMTGIHHRESFKREQILQIVKDAGLSVQFYFVHYPQSTFADLQEEVNVRVTKMKQYLEKIRSFPEYVTLYPQIEEFREKALHDGIEPVPRIVLVCRKLSAS